MKLCGKLVSHVFQIYDTSNQDFRDIIKQPVSTFAGPPPLAVNRALAPEMITRSLCSNKSIVLEKKDKTGFENSYHHDYVNNKSH